MGRPVRHGEEGEPRIDVAAPVVATLRRTCGGFPDSVEEEAWVGTRWRVRGHTFAHVLTISDGWPPAYARAAGTEGPTVVLMFRSSGPELDALRNTGDPFFAPPWRANEVGLVLDEATDWDEVTELLTESYCLLAPNKLSALVARPSDDDRS